MKLLLIHLSDMHLKDDTHEVLKRGNAIVDSVKNLEYSGLNAVFIVVSGDIAFSGETKQYDIADRFLSSISEKLRETLPGIDSHSIPINIVVVPGNHDCDFTNVKEIREVALKHVVYDLSKAVDDSVIDSCTEVQNAFFEFRNKLSSRLETDIVGEKERLAHEQIFEIDNKTIQFVCCNTAWLSTKTESQTERIFPESVIPSEKNSHELAITAFHHPFNWFKADVARSFRTKVENISDIILTGHEHNSTFLVQTRDGDNHNTHIEGGILWDSSSPESSNFNAIIIDTKNRKQKHWDIKWDGQRYIETNNPNWEEFRPNLYRQIDRFELNESAQEALIDLGMGLTHHDHGRLTLEDVFVFPDLRKLANDGQVSDSVLSGEKVQEILREKTHLLITGGDQSGKSSLAKMAFKTLFAEGLVPILLNGGQLHTLGDKLHNYLYEIFEEQYSPSLTDAYKQLDFEKRAIIIDDYHNLPLKARRKRELVAQLTEFSGRVILFADDVELALVDFSNPSGISDGHVEFDCYSIQAFGYMRRNVLLEKWLHLSDDCNPETSTYGYQLRQITLIVDSLIGKNYLPAYPVYILCILQTYEAGAQLDTRASTHGYYYELLIKNALAHGRTSIQYGTIIAYLSHLAYRLFQSRKKWFDHSGFRAIHDEYERLYEYDIPFDQMLKLLLAEKILEESDDYYRFKYKYIYNYFVANFMSDHVNEDGENIKAEIAEISRKLYVEEYANILLFLAHLSKDNFIINEMINAASEPFSDKQPADFSKDLGFLSELDDITRELALEESCPSDNRKTALREMDKNETPNDLKSKMHGSTDIVEPSHDSIDLTMRINAAIKTLQILGQTVKNFPGSMKGDNKLDITNACCQLGLRILSAFLDIVRENKKEITAVFIDSIRENSPDIDLHKLEARAKKTIVGMTELTAYCLIKRISLDIGSPELFKTYERLIKQDSSTAIELIHASLLIDHKEHFPDKPLVTLASNYNKKNWFAFAILRLLVIQHFYLFEVHHTKRQRILQALKIPYKKLQATNPKRKMLGDGR